MKQFISVNSEDNVKGLQIYFFLTGRRSKVVADTFSRKLNPMLVTMILGNDARSQPARNSRRTLLKYCACAWGLPAVIVVTCFALDFTDTVSIGYGKQES